MASLLWYTNHCAKTPDKKITHILSFSVTLFIFFLFSFQRYNHNCAKTPDEKIDGVAVNNEDYPGGAAEEKVAFLTNLSKIGPLK